MEKGGGGNGISKQSYWDWQRDVAKNRGQKREKRPVLIGYHGICRMVDKHWEFYKGYFGLDTGKTAEKTDEFQPCPRQFDRSALVIKCHPIASL